MRLLTSSSMLGSVNRPWLWAGLAGGAILLLLWQISAPPANLLFSDFLQAYYPAGERLWRAGPVIIWPLNETCTEGFVNIPILGWLFVPFAWLGKSAAAWSFLALGIAAATAAWAHIVRLCRLEARWAALLLFLFLANGPMVHSFREGNITHIVLLLLVVALLLWRAGAEYTAGLVFGLCAILKLPLLLIGLYFLLRRRCWIVAGGVTAIGAVVALSIAVFGLTLNIGWYNYCVRPFVGQIMPGFNAQSVDAFLFRLVDGQAHLHIWYLLSPTRAHTIARTIVLAAMFLGAFLLIWRAERRGPMPAVTGRLSSRDLIEFTLVLNLALVASPVSWSHYYLLLLLPWGLYLGGQLSLPNDAVTKWLMWGGIFFASLPVLMLPKDLGVLAPLLSRTFVSGTFVGGMLTLAALARGAWHLGRPPALGEHARAASPATAAMRLVTSGVPGGLSPSEMLTRNMLIFLLVNACVVNAILWSVTPLDLADTALQHTWRFVLSEGNDDSWGPMMLGLQYFENEYVRPPYTRPIYSELVFHRGEKFQYPPSSLFFVTAVRGAVALLSQQELSYEAISSACNAISWLAVVLTAIAAAILFENRLRLTELSARHDNLAWLRVIIVIGLALTFYPVVKAFTVGQIQAWINGLFAIAFLLWAMGYKAWTGVAIGLVALIKPHFGILLLWAALRREWRFIMTGAVTVALGLGLSLYVFGWENHVDYLRLLSHLSQRGEAYYPNQSFNGLLNRLMSIGDPVNYNNLKWRDDHFPPFNPWVYGVTLLSSVAILGLALFRRRRRDDADGMLDFCTIAVSATIASPIAWEHHYGALFPVFLVLAATSLHSRHRLIWLAASFVLASSYLPVTRLLAQTVWNVAQSYLLVAGLIVLVLLHSRGSMATARRIRPSAPAKETKAVLA